MPIRKRATNTPTGRSTVRRLVGHKESEPPVKCPRSTQAARGNSGRTQLQSNARSSARPSPGQSVAAGTRLLGDAARSTRALTRFKVQRTKANYPVRVGRRLRMNAPKTRGKRGRPPIARTNTRPRSFFRLGIPLASRCLNSFAANLQNPSRKRKDEFAEVCAGRSTRCSEKFDMTALLGEQASS